MEFEYEKKLKQARDRLEVAGGAVADAAAALDVVANTLIHQDAPRDVEGSCADLVDAGAHARSTCRQVADVASQASEVAKEIGAVGKLGAKIEFAARRLFADLTKRADDEEKLRRDRQTRLNFQARAMRTDADGEQPEGDIRAPREIPGLDPELLNEIAEELEEGAALTIQVLGYRVGLRQEGPFDAGALIDTIVGSMAAEGAKVELSKAERWAFTAGVKQAAAELAKVEDDGTPFASPEPRPLDPDHFEELKAQARQMGAAHRAGAPEGWHGLPSLLDALGGPAVFDDTPAAQRDAIAAAYEVGRTAPTAGPGATTVSQDAPALRAPKDVPDVDTQALKDLGSPATWRDAGRTFAYRNAISGDKADDVTGDFLADLRDGDAFELTAAEDAELRAGVAEGIAAVEQKEAAAPGPLAKQVQRNVEGIEAQRAREQAAAPKKRGRPKKGAAS